MGKGTYPKLNSCVICVVIELARINQKKQVAAIKIYSILNDTIVNIYKYDIKRVVQFFTQQLFHCRTSFMTNNLVARTQYFLQVPGLESGGTKATNFRFDISLPDFNFCLSKLVRWELDRRRLRTGRRPGVDGLPQKVGLTSGPAFGATRLSGDRRQYQRPRR